MSVVLLCLCPIRYCVRFEVLEFVIIHCCKVVSKIVKSDVFD